jgi:hypothetical protein
MGAKSTRDISRSFAIRFIEEHLHNMNDEALADLVEVINDNLRDKQDWDNSLGLHNFCIRDHCDED